MMNLIKDNNEKLAHQFECYIEGLHARFTGQTVDKNPYEARTYMSDAWISAWDLVDLYLTSMIVYSSAKYQYLNEIEQYKERL